MSPDTQALYRTRTCRKSLVSQWVLNQFQCCREIYPKAARPPASGEEEILRQRFIPSGFLYLALASLHFFLILQVWNDVLQGQKREINPGISL